MEFPYGEFDDGAHYRQNLDEYLRYGDDRPDFPVDECEPLEPKRPCEVCGLYWAVEEIPSVDPDCDLILTDVCQECAQEYYNRKDDNMNNCIMPTPLDPHRPCDECRRELAEEQVVDHGVTYNFCSVCFQSWCEQFEPADAHYYPRS